MSGAPGRGVEHARADCPACGRPSVPGGVDHETGHVILRRHKGPDGKRWCSDRQRIDAGPASPILAAAYEIVRDDRNRRSAT